MRKPEFPFTPHTTIRLANPGRFFMEIFYGVFWWEDTLGLKKSNDKSIDGSDRYRRCYTR
ncbi:MAG: hypothetical protein SFT94_06360 [Pseudanabaenaceae cyanobacterium bins.68]|nr:hypothetical protein [Pseudanabaenaceae cyanobacterium bins.68]